MLTNLSGGFRRARVGSIFCFKGDKRGCLKLGQLQNGWFHKTRFLWEVRTPPSTGELFGCFSTGGSFGSVERGSPDYGSSIDKIWAKALTIGGGGNGPMNMGVEG